MILSISPLTILYIGKCNMSTVHLKYFKIFHFQGQSILVLDIVLQDKHSKAKKAYWLFSESNIPTGH